MSSFSKKVTAKILLATHTIVVESLNHWVFALSDFVSTQNAVHVLSVTDVSRKKPAVFMLLSIDTMVIKKETPQKLIVDGEKLLIMGILLLMIHPNTLSHGANSQSKQKKDVLYNNSYSFINDSIIFINLSSHLFF